ncbi:unnamed protein product [Linum trigynum]|uniref:Transposase MuDR plant domain-containing protein n=1 Tax=Linum trigynum TaxID=586398 RepID=A0AAV2CCC4_9ROSI
MPIVDDDSLNVLFDFMAQNPYCLGAEIHAELSENRDGEEEDTWSMPSNHDDVDGEEDDAEEEEEEDGEGEQPNYPPYFYLQGNEEDDELSYADSYGVIPMPVVASFGEFYKGQIFHSKQAAQMAVKYHALQRNFQYGVVESSPSIWKVRCLRHKDDNCPWMVRCWKRMDCLKGRVGAFL